MFIAWGIQYLRIGVYSKMFYPLSKINPCVKII